MERLVEDFGELHVGMRVIVKPCRHCGAAHRGFLIAFHRMVTGWDQGRFFMDQDVWECVPAIECVGPEYHWGINEPTVRAKMVYEQVDQTPEEKRWQRATPKPRPKFKAPDLSKLKVRLPK